MQQNDDKKPGDGTRKKLIPTKRPPPQVKHTKTSLKRMFKANPLLQLKAAGNIDEFLKNYSKFEGSKNNTAVSSASQQHIINKNKIAADKKQVENRSSQKSVASSSSSCSSKAGSKDTFKKPAVTHLKVPAAPQFTLRKSLSTGHLKTEENPLPTKFASKENLIQEPSNFVFKSPSSYQRRSILHSSTPGTVRKSSFLISSTPNPTYYRALQERLNKWLQSRGKRVSSYQHLKCFGAHNEVLPKFEEENKENIQVSKEKSLSYEDLRITEPVSKEDEQQPPSPVEDTRQLAKGALLDLQTLLVEDYPREQCNEWLNLIKEKYPGVDDEPEFWECKAAIEQAVGNVANALEFYKNAIIHGAEINTVEKSLDQLMKKFGLLHISSSRSQDINPPDSEKERIVREARNVFKSTIIQFAIREKKSQKDTNLKTAKPAEFVVTPVRRSTRLSRSGYVTTPGVTLCSSLREINLSDERMNFEKNKALC